jgi:hypothetical protein
MNRELKLLNILLPSTYGYLVLLLNIPISAAYLQLAEIEYSRQEFSNVLMFLTAVDLVITIKGFIIKRIYYRLTMEKAIQKIVSHLIEYDYPEPSITVERDFEWYIQNIIDDDEIDPTIRVDAAKLFATCNAMFPTDNESYLNSSQFIVFSTAIARYKKIFN